MKSTSKRPKFFAIYKDFNSGEVEKFDVLSVIFNSFLTEKNTIKKKEFCVFEHKNKKLKYVPVRTKEQCEKYITDCLRYHFWSKCEWEFIIVDWPNRDTVDESRPVKIDVFDQLKPNIPVITDLVWNYIEPKVNKLIEKEK